MNYVNYYRIEQAAFLLDSTDMPITQIATESGFWESSYFTKVFKKYKGTTPQRHRNATRSERCQPYLTNSESKIKRRMADD
jgi:AraC-like DNA-binding protein